MYIYTYVHIHTHTNTHIHPPTYPPISIYGVVEDACSVASELDKDVDVVAVDALCHG
jgi:hypothetical protein